MVSRKGQVEPQTIFGAIISIVILFIFLSAMIPIFQSLTGADGKQAEINKLANENSELRQALQNNAVELTQLQNTLGSLNSTLEEKDQVIYNLTGQVAERDAQIDDLSSKLKEYSEREYLPTINNNYYNILNYVERIENKFYTINLAIGLISITLLGIVVKLFGLDVTIKLLIGKLRKKRK